MSSRILVIDDEESIRFTFNEFLSEKGHVVTCAETFHQAVEIIAQNELDLILVDILLGEHSGIEILKIVKREGILCPVIMITGQPDIETAADSVRLGAFDYLSKPVHQDTLLRVTQIALAHKAVLAEKERYRNNLDAIFRSVSDAIITIDNHMQVLEANAAVEKVCGISAREIIGQPYHEVDNPGLEACGKVIEQVRTNGTNVRECRVECHPPGQPSQILAVNGSPLIDRQARLIGAVVVIRDVTRLSAIESELKERHSFHNIIGKSEKMQAVFRLIENLADIQTTVLITGESGTGKELIAKALHYSGPRGLKPMITVNCSTLVENLLESELFGHVKGAFTGAVKDKAGRFQEADRGSIFLDEIGDISSMIQLKLLRVLQEKTFEKVGDSTPIQVDVRVIAATNRRLDHLVAEGKFREDLFYRLKVVEIVLPPLRERLEDIPLLVKHFCARYNTEFNKAIEGVTDEVLAAFMRYPWPGNIRELEHALERAFVFCRSDIISIDHLPPEILRSRNDRQVQHPSNPREAERILQTLRMTDGNRAKTARLLGISRKTLYKKLKKYNLQNP